MRTKFILKSFMPLRAWNPRQGKINDYYLLKNAKDVDNTEVNEK
jgi:hypothetical protein